MYVTVYVTSIGLLQHDKGLRWAVLWGPAAERGAHLGEGEPEVPPRGSRPGSLAEAAPRGR